MKVPYVCPICRHYGLKKEELTYNSYTCPACGKSFHKDYLHQTPILIEELTEKQYGIEIYMERRD